MIKCLIYILLKCTEHICKNAIDSAIPDIEDAVLYHIALHNKMDYFITNDKTDFKNIPHRSLPVFTSPQFTTVLKGHH